jgi:hypothetical protein
MMERSTKFLSLSGWAGIMAGIYALAGACIAYFIFDFNPDSIIYGAVQPESVGPDLYKVIWLGFTVLILALGTAIIFSKKKAEKSGEKIWNSTSRRLISSMAVPLSTGGILILLLISKGYIVLIAPLTLLFYGLALYSAGKYTIDDVKYLGFVQIVFGLTAVWFIEYGLLLWVIGFGFSHIIYGTYMYFRYER